MHKPEHEERRLTTDNSATRTTAVLPKRCS